MCNTNIDYIGSLDSLWYSWYIKTGETQCFSRFGFGVTSPSLREFFHGLKIHTILFA